MGSQNSSPQNGGLVRKEHIVPRVSGLVILNIIATENLINRNLDFMLKVFKWITEEERETGIMNNCLLIVLLPEHINSSITYINIAAGNKENEIYFYEENGTFRANFSASTVYDLHNREPKTFQLEMITHEKINAISSKERGLSTSSQLKLRASASWAVKEQKETGSLGDCEVSFFLGNRIDVTDNTLYKLVTGNGSNQIYLEMVDGEIQATYIKQTWKVWFWSLVRFICNALTFENISRITKAISNLRTAFIIA